VLADLFPALAEPAPRFGLPRWAFVLVQVAGCHMPMACSGAVQVRYRYRVYPSPGQRQALTRVFGCARVVYNDCLRLREAAHAAGKKVSDTEVQHQVVTLAKRTPEREWLARAQRALSRKQKGSANRAKALRQVTGLHRKVREAWLDHAHKTALRLVRDNQAVYAEDLAVSGLTRTRLAKSVHDAGWAQPLRLLAEKAEDYGRTFHRIGRFVPSSQTCSGCGAKDGPKPLSARTWACAACGTVHDRDVNAARNILAAGRAKRRNACGGRVRPGHALAAASEVGTHRGAA
jgi:Putative transposase DNA-binding domain/Helix-turn-helix domain/Probable transposase